MKNQTWIVQRLDLRIPRGWVPAEPVLDGAVIRTRVHGSRDSAIDAATARRNRIERAFEGRMVEKLRIRRVRVVA